MFYSFSVREYDVISNSYHVILENSGTKYLFKMYIDIVAKMHNPAIFHCIAQLHMHTKVGAVNVIKH